MILEIITYTLIIFITALSPIPALPFVIFNYEQNSFLIAAISTISGTLLAGFIHYKFANLIYIKLIKSKFPKMYFYIKKFSPLIKSLNYFELFLLIISSTIPGTIISITAGICKLQYRKYLICSFIGSLPYQFIYLFAANESKNVQDQFIKLGFNQPEALLASISFGCILVFIILFITKILKTYLKKNSKFSFLKKN